MQLRFLYVVANAVAIAVLTVSAAMGRAEDFVWQSVSAVPSDENMPLGVTADILGLKVGSSIDEVRHQLESIAAEAKESAPRASPDQSTDLYSGMYGSTDGSDLDGSAGGGPITETDMAFVLPASDGNRIEVSFPQRLRYESDGYVRTSESITTYFSAPSSGAQLLAVYRSLVYNDTATQPKISEVVAGLREKFGPQFQQTYDYGSSVLYQVNFDSGIAWSEPDQQMQSCAVQLMDDLGFDESVLVDINKSGRCDIVLAVEFRRGISADHAGTIIFRLSDNERGRKALSTDFQYLRDYMSGRLQQGGTVPKL